MGDFLPLMTRNAHESLRIEDGCLRFDVLKVADDPDQILLYEIYADESAFDEHCRMHHFLQFDAESRPFVKEKTVVRAELIGF